MRVKSGVWRQGDAFYGLVAAVGEFYFYAGVEKFGHPVEFVLDEEREGLGEVEFELGSRGPFAECFGAVDVLVSVGGGDCDGEQEGFVRVVRFEF